MKVCPRARHDCPFCGKLCQSHSSLSNHKRQCRKRSAAATASTTADSQDGKGEKRQRLKCRKCGFMCEDRRQLVRHHTSQHGNANDLQQFDVDLGDDAGLKREYDINRTHILAGHRENREGAVYNFPTNDLRGGVQELREQLEDIYNRESNAFRLNIAVGMILRDIETGDERYFIPLDNEMLFQPRNETISNRRDLNRVLDRLRRLDVREYVNNRKPKSSLKPQFVTNLEYYVYRTGFPLGATLDLPVRLRNHRCIVGLVKDANNTSYDDNLCLLRCLCYHRFKRVTQADVIDLFNAWCTYIDMEMTVESFHGVDFSELPSFEDCFGLSVNMYEFMIDTESVTPRYLSISPHDDTMYVNLFGNHTSYISNFRGYAKKFQCPSCDRHFDRINNWNVHLKVCSNVKKVRFPGGFYSAPRTIFECLSDYDVNVPNDLRTSPYFAVYDFESLLERRADNPSDKLSFTHYHIPISVSINSNVPGFQSPCHLVDTDVDALVEQMIAYLKRISDKACALTRDKLKDAILSLQEKFDSAPKHDCAVNANDLHDVQARGERVGFDDDDDDDNDHDGDNDEIELQLDASFIDDDAHEFVENHENPYLHQREVEGTAPAAAAAAASAADRDAHPEPGGFMRRRIKCLQQQLEVYCSRLPVLGFNSAKYDLNLVKSKLAKYLHLADKDTFVIKRAQAYTCISTSYFKFLDVTAYLAAGASYSQFLRAYGVDEEKGFFPYEWFDCAAKLDYPRLPPYEAFFSQLKNVNVLDTDGNGRANYNALTMVWERQQMHTFRDFLKYYNNSDVIGFVHAVDKMLQFYSRMGVDLFKDTISLPNLARTQLFKQSNTQFPLFDSTNQDLYRIVQQNIVGGPSIIFKREAIAGETPIRNNPNEIGQRILGHDANGLYAFCIAQEMPTGCYVDRRAENDFKPEISHKYMDMFFWLDYVSENDGIFIKHRLNNANREVRIGPYLLDGFCVETKTAYEYQGCWYHFCDECQTSSMNAKTRKRQETARKRTIQKRKYLESQGYEVVEMRECYFKQHILADTEHIQERYVPHLYSFWKGKMRPECIIDFVIDDKFFGMVEVDISVPETWRSLDNEGDDNDDDDDDDDGDNEEPPRFQHVLPPKEYFADMPPIFCTTDVPFEHFGVHMQEFVRANDLSMKPRRLLVGGMSAKKILLITPLLRWYLSKGLRVTRVYRMVEFIPKACFKGMADDVAQARREGDLDASKKIIADTNKLLICSAYGGLLLNKEKHRSIKYVQGSRALRLKVNDPLFCHFTKLDDDFYEVEMLKNRVSLDLPNYLGLFVLNYAKLHMLQFVYDVLYHYIPRNRFELMEMDTDSIYAYYGARKLEDLMSDERRVEFEEKLVHSCYNDGRQVDSRTGHWFPRECCREHIAYDRRTPGLFKLEASGDYMVCLSSKTYMLRDGDNRAKFSCKGVQKRRIDEPEAIYRGVIHSTASHEVENIGFRARANTIQTYRQRKTGFSYFYVKREVCPNGVDTKPISLTLTPWPLRDYIVVGPRSVLSNDFKSEIVHDDITFFSVHHCYMHEVAVYHECMDKAIEILLCQNWFQLKKIQVDFTPTADWYTHATAFMQEMLNLKRDQCADFNDELHRQAGRTFYVSGFDRYWTCGFNERTANVVDASQFPGRNVLGKLLYTMSNN